jgi:chloramphenicol O-acetyltransferase type A
VKEIVFETGHRQKHFDFFNGMNHPYFNITAMVDISHFYSQIKKKGISFTPALVYLISRAANEVKEFRWRIRSERIMEHELVHPSFTVETQGSDVFSFCYVYYAADAMDFIHRAQLRMEEMKEQPVMEDEPERDDYLFLSANPWMHFTSMQHAMQSHPGDSVPRIVWGKFQANGKRLDLPLSVQVHHAIVDGRHVGQFFEYIQHLLNCDDWMDSNVTR